MIKLVNVSRFLSNFKFHVTGVSLRRLSSVHEPEYLELLKPKLPVYEPLVIQIKGYDFTVLESYAKHVHSMALTMGVDVEDCWASPCQSLRITTLKHKSDKKDSEYNLKLYERNVKVVNLTAVKLPLLIEVIQSALPEGVQLTLHPHKKEYDEVRYIPDLELAELKRQLDELINPPSIHKKKV